MAETWAQAADAAVVDVLEDGALVVDVVDEVVLDVALCVVALEFFLGGFELPQAARASASARHQGERPTTSGHPSKSSGRTESRNWRN